MNENNSEKRQSSFVFFCYQILITKDKKPQAVYWKHYIKWKWWTRKREHAFYNLIWSIPNKPPQLTKNVGFTRYNSQRQSIFPSVIKTRFYGAQTLHLPLHILTWTNKYNLLERIDLIQPSIEKLKILNNCYEENNTFTYLCADIAVLSYLFEIVLFFRRFLYTLYFYRQKTLNALYLKPRKKMKRNRACQLKTW